jgi:hypothetical protein
MVMEGIKIYCIFLVASDLFLQRIIGLKIKKIYENETLLHLPKSDRLWQFRKTEKENNYYYYNINFFFSFPKTFFHKK